MSAEHLKLGQLTDEVQRRDAIHIAVVPVVAGAVLAPGAKVEIVDDTAVPADPGVGVVDPFLRAEVKAGQRFWLFLNPGSITSLRHEWTHPAFPLVDETLVRDAINRLGGDSQQWLSEFAKQGGVSYDELIEALEEGESISFNNETTRDEAQSQPDEIWRHFEVVTGKQVSQEHRNGFFFSCGC
jgi:hypothetical protein